MNHTTEATPDVWDYYATTELHLTGPTIQQARRRRTQQARYGTTIHVISAYNPNGEPRDAAENREHDADLHALLLIAKLAPARVMAGHDDHYEPSWATFELSRDQACVIGRAVDQHAIFELNVHQTEPAATRHLVRCHDHQTIDTRKIDL